MKIILKYQIQSFQNNYEGLKLDFVSFLYKKKVAGFQNNYEGLKPSGNDGDVMIELRFQNNYEGLKLF